MKYHTKGSNTINLNNQHVSLIFSNGQMFRAISGDFRFAEGFLCMCLRGAQGDGGGVASIYLIIFLGECDLKLA